MQDNSQDMKTKSSRYYYIDLLESIAIFMVIAFHATNYEFDFVNDSSNVIFYIRYFYRTILSCCVPLFFFANGYLLLNREFNLKKHILKILRLIIITVIWGMIELFLFMYIKNEPLSFNDFMVGLWTFKRGWISHLWYIPALVVIYLLFPLIKNVYDNRRDIFYYFIIISAILTFGNVFLNIIISISSHLITGNEVIYSQNWFNEFNVFRDIYGYSFVYFCVGGIAGDIINKFKFLEKTICNIVVIILSMLGLFLLGIVLSKVQNKVWDVVWYGYDSVFTFINVICIFSLCKKYNGKDCLFRKIITFISVNTLGIYLIHALYFRAFAPRIADISIISNIPGNLCYSILILFLSLGTVLIIKNIPLLKYLL